VRRGWRHHRSTGPGGCGWSRPRRLGRTPSTRVLLAATVRADAGLAERLQVADGAGVHLAERLRLVDGEPAMVERAHLPADLVPGLRDAASMLSDRTLADPPLSALATTAS
jgi:DNA-binding GntR family transcriptional regulator